MVSSLKTRPSETKEEQRIVSLLLGKGLRCSSLEMTVCNCDPLPSGSIIADILISMQKVWQAFKGQ